MDPDLARWVTSDAARPALEAAAREPDPSSLAAATRLRAMVEPDQAAAVLAQAALRSRAVVKFGARAREFFFTADGLEQATRESVAARRAHRFAPLTDHVVDLGCGLGADSLALLDAGLTVDAVELDPTTAVLADANFRQAAKPSSSPVRGAVSRAAQHPVDGGRVVVNVGDAARLWPTLATPGVGVFCDPARRTASGRTWRIEDLTPPWDFALSLLDGSRPACLKLGPGVPHRLLPPDADVEWISESGTVVECSVWAGPGAAPGRRAAVVDGVELTSMGRQPGVAAAGAIEAFLYEPDGAVIRAGLVEDLAALLRAHRVHPDVAYLTAPWHVPTPFASCFAVREVLPYDEKTLRAWVRDTGVGTLEIKKRALDVDPAALRRRLKPRGAAAATLILTPTPTGAVAVVAERLRSHA